ncbi:hypothetical protein NDU88_005351 [Pleurodeles waltl]|uniref:Uncharacterized protein n=1 Tax=Pleurodeles waltl TaxID=8319 RepID=A0AAV7MCK9_PLEWA|nr:hypothetical protein NDU88_005351 [Pleurodeles waltl]
MLQDCNTNEKRAGAMGLMSQASIRQFTSALLCWWTPVRSNEEDDRSNAILPEAYKEEAFKEEAELAR